MDRRTFTKTTVATAVLAGAGCSGLAYHQRGSAVRSLRPGAGMGTNLSGMEWAKPGLRLGLSSAPNLHFTVPRKADVAYLAACGYTRNRLPIQWELLQPMLHDTRANEEAVAAIGRPGEFHAAYASYITDVLDAHAAAGIKCILDCHNYARYRDFRYQPDGSVAGLTRPPDAGLRPYTRERDQVQERIFSLAPGATLTQAHFTDFWTRAARRWKDHPGFGGYGLMNEPHDMPRPGEVTASEGGGEDLAIWPAYAQAAVRAIRAVDAANPIYVAGNEWSSAMAMATRNPGFPLQGANLVYEVHLYLDAFSNGQAFDYDAEVGKQFSAGIGRRPIDPDTGVDRLRLAVDWARSHGVKLALTEIGMPIDDPRWEPMFARTVAYAWRNGCEVYSWMGGSHWPIRNYAINHAPGWYQNRTLEPLVSGPMKACAGIARAVLFDEGPGWVAAGQPVTVTVRARGYLPEPLVLQVKASSGRLSSARLTLPAGANSQANYTYTAEGEGTATLHYSGPRSVEGVLPPPRRVYALADPVAHAATDLEEAALALLARLGACKWDMADGHTDFLDGQPCQAGQPLRAVADSGYGSTPGNAMEMVNWFNTDNPQAGPLRPPVLRVAGGRRFADLSAPGTTGLWCKKSVPTPRVQPRPVNRVPYDLQDPHFVLALVALPQAAHSGVVFQASQAEERHACELAFARNQAQARWVDANGQEVVLTAPAPVRPGGTAVLALTARPGEQVLRQDGAVVGRASARFAPSTFAQMLLGWGFLSYYPRDSFGGHLHAVITGKGVPAPAELALLERYLAARGAA